MTRAEILDGLRDGKYLGMDAAELRRALARGKTPAELAKDKGKSADGLKDALRSAIREDADKAVDAGDLTRKEAVDTGLKGGCGFRLKGGDRHGDFEFHLRVGPSEARP